MNHCMLSILLASLLAASVPACDRSGGDEMTDGEYETAFPAGKADSPYSECELNHVAAYLSNPLISYEDLRSEGVHSRAARNLIAYRDGEDSVAGTADDNYFETVEEVDSVRYVGPVAMSQLAQIVRPLCEISPAADVIFSPQLYADSHLIRTANLIDQADTSIDIAMYSMSDSSIADALERAVGRGVSVRMIFEPARDDRSDPEGSWSEKMETMGIDVRWVNKIMHHKFAIIDGPRSSMDRAYSATLITGSANWSHSAGTKYDENTIFIEGSGELVMRFQDEFNLLWENSRDYAYGHAYEWFGSMDINDPMIVDDPNIDAVFTSANFRTYISSYGPTFSVLTGLNAVSDRLVELIEGAQHSIHIASGHLRSRPVAEALMAKHASNPEMDIRVYLDNQEYISEWYNNEQERDLQACLEEAGDSESRQQACIDKGFYFSYPLHQAGIALRFKYYCYRWDYHYAEQMHHKYLIFDGQILASGSYNLSDNAEHNTMENMVIYDAARFPQLLAAFEENFETLWVTGEEGGLYEQLLYLIEFTTDPIPIVFDPMALTWDQVTELKDLIREYCPDINSEAFRDDPVGHQTCYR